MAKGSWRNTPTSPFAAAVRSEERAAPKRTPWFQLKDWTTSGRVAGRRHPKRMAERGTPSGLSQRGSTMGHWERGAVKRALGWAAGVPSEGVQALPFQSVSAGGGALIPSHQTSPSGVRAVLVKRVFLARVSMAFGLEATEVPGATPKRPASGLMA